MQLIIRRFTPADAEAACAVWNEVVAAGNAFPQEEALNPETGCAFFLEQTWTGLACRADTGEIAGLYILHPNNVGRCGHIANASYAVRSEYRGRRVGEQLVLDCMGRAKAEGFRILQFNAVVAANTPALKLYRKLGFRQLGVIPGGFRMPDGSYADIIPHYIIL